MVKIKIFILFILILFIFLSSQNTNFFYEIVTDFSILYDNVNFNSFILYYRYYEQAKQRYFIYGYDTINNKFYGFSPAEEFITTKPFLNSENSAFAYGALYQGNDFVWFKDFKNKIGYKILYSISGKLSLLSLSKSLKNIIVGFDYLAPQKFLYISGIKEFYTYPLASYPNIVETGFTPDENYVYVIFSLENKLYCDLLALSSDPYHSSSYKPAVKNLFSEMDKLIFKSDSGIITKKNNQFFFYNLKDYKITRTENLKVLIDKNDEKNALIMIDGSIYNKNFDIISISENNYNFNESSFTNYLKLQNKVLFLDNHLIITAEDSKIFIFKLLDDYNQFELINIISNDIKGCEQLELENICLISLSNESLYFLVQNRYPTTNSISLLIRKENDTKIETIYSDNIYKFEKALNCKEGIAFLIKKSYTKGIFQELYYYSFIKNEVIKVSGWENVQDNELQFLIRKVK